MNTPTSPSKRPVVIIPGILGSRLLDGGGNVVWGDLSSLGRFGRLDLGPAETNGDELRTDGLIERIRVLGPFWTIHAYEHLISHLIALGFRMGNDLFTFDYDWRRSNYASARLFDAWVRRNPVLQAGKFDIIAHSMGGYVSKIWMHELGGATQVRKVLYLGTPFLGSMNILATLTDGWGLFANRIAGGINVVRSTLLSFPSVYELFPHYPRACRLGDRNSHTFLDIFDPDEWNMHGWLPDEYRDGGSRAKSFRESLTMAKSIASILTSQVSGVEEVRIAGDRQNTRLYLYVNREYPSWKNWTFSSSRGDGTVPIWSAANAPTGNLAGALPSFVEHATIFHDEWVKTVLLRELVITAPPTVNAWKSEIETRSGSAVTLDLVDAQLEPPLAAPGASVRLVVTLHFPANAQVGRDEVLHLTTQIAGTDAPIVVLVDVTDDIGFAENTLTFEAELIAPMDEEVYRVDLNIPPLGQCAIYLTVEHPQ